MRSPWPARMVECRHGELKPRCPSRAYRFKSGSGHLRTCDAVRGPPSGVTRKWPAGCADVLRLGGPSMTATARPLRPQRPHPQGGREDPPGRRRPGHLPLRERPRPAGMSQDEGNRALAERDALTWLHGAPGEDTGADNALAVCATSAPTSASVCPGKGRAQAPYGPAVLPAAGPCSSGPVRRRSPRTCRGRPSSGRRRRAGHRNRIWRWVRTASSRRWGCRRCR